MAEWIGRRSNGVCRRGYDLAGYYHDGSKWFLAPRERALGQLHRLSEKLRVLKGQFTHVERLGRRLECLILDERPE